jgi:hypothetical protein
VSGAVRGLLMRTRRVGLSLMAIAAGIVPPVLAQTPGAAALPPPGALEISGGGVFVGGYGLGERTAELTPNSTSTGGFDLFETDSRVRDVFGLQARIGFVVTSALVVEGGFRFTRPVYEVRVTADAESAADTTSEETLSQYVFDGSVVWHFTGAALGGGRGVPFVFGGAGYLRELHEEDALVEDGLEYHAGGGLKWWFGQGRRRVGLRGEAGVSIRDGGFDFEDGQRVVPTAGGFLIVSF